MTPKGGPKLIATNGPKPVAKHRYGNQKLNGTRNKRNRQGVAHLNCEDLACYGVLAEKPKLDCQISIYRNEVNRQTDAHSKRHTDSGTNTQSRADP